MLEPLMLEEQSCVQFHCQFQNLLFSTSSVALGVLDENVSRRGIMVWIN
jgi:hypothetical protein